VHAVDWVGANAVPGRLRTVLHVEDFTVPELAAAHDRGLLEPCAHICVSAAVAAELVTGWGRAAEVIGTGVDAERFTAAAGTDPDATEGRRYWTDRFGDFVLAVGGIEPRKGTVELVRAMARVRRRRPGTRLVIAGGDTRLGFWEYRRDVNGLAARLRIEPEILGPVPQAQLPSLVAAARVFAFGSIRAGSGLAAMEALAAGVPVVTRDLPEFREVFEDAVGFAEIGDGSSADVAAGLATRLVAALEGAPEPTGRDDGIALAARHNWDDAAAAHVALYHRLIAAGLPVGMAPAVR
jgi:glycosyltransferase involved in cell wall biosynthesis